MKSKPVYYDKDNFNGILIVLREPHHENADAETAYKGNKYWFTQRIISDNPNPKRNRLETRYRLRFEEMVSICSETSIKSISFANIKQSGGGKQVSKEYLETEEMERKSSLNDIIANLNGLKFVFVLKEIFEIIEKETGFYNNGIQYDGHKHKGKPCRMTELNGITYYEILHPCISPRILIKDSRKEETLCTDTRIM